MIALVKDGVVLQEGYGLADVALQRPMDRHTPMRIGSVTKLITALAVMQLADEGRVALDEDVNRYLDFSVPSSSGRAPVTLRRLLSHQSAFADRIGGSPLRLIGLFRSVSFSPLVKYHALDGAMALWPMPTTTPRGRSQRRRVSGQKEWQVTSLLRGIRRCDGAQRSASRNRADGDIHYSAVTAFALGLRRSRGDPAYASLACATAARRGPEIRVP